MYDLIIIGGGPAGVAAGVYAARKRLKTLFITKDFGGQSVVSENIQNWIGTISITGNELAENLKNHLVAYAGDVVKIKTGDFVEKVSKIPEGFSVKTTKEELQTKTVLITTGSHRRKLEIPGAKEFENKGITYCASCDGPLFADKDVVVIGGGNAGFETAAQLAAYCKSVTLIQRGVDFRADPSTVEKVLAKPNVKAITGTELIEVKGDKFANAIVYKLTATGEIVTLPTDGIFVEIGLLPSTEFVKDLVALDKWGHIVVDPKNQRAFLIPSEIALGGRREENDTRGVGNPTTSVASSLRNESGKVISGGIWAAGDATDGLYHQNNIAAGDAVKALEDIYLYLHAK